MRARNLIGIYVFCLDICVNQIARFPQSPLTKRQTKALKLIREIVEAKANQRSQGRRLCVPSPTHSLG